MKITYRKPPGPYMVYDLLLSQTITGYLFIDILADLFIYLSDLNVTYLRIINT